MERRYPDTLCNYVVRTMGSSVSEILIFGWVLACIGSEVNIDTVDFGTDINNELYISVVAHVSCCDELFPSFLLLIFHVVHKCVPK